jgi:hypothetical protein
MEVCLGAALLIAWALVVVWSLAMIAVSVWRTRHRKRDKWERYNFGLGLLAGAALAGGISLAVEQDRVVFGGIHTIGLGFALASVATLVLLALMTQPSALRACPHSLGAAGGPLAALKKAPKRDGDH